MQQYVSRALLEYKTEQQSLIDSTLSWREGSLILLFGVFWFLRVGFGHLWQLLNDECESVGGTYLKRASSPPPLLLHFHPQLEGNWMLLFLNAIVCHSNYCRWLKSAVLVLFLEEKVSAPFSHLILRFQVILWRLLALNLRDFWFE